MSASAGQFDILNGRTTTDTRLSLTAIHAKMLLILPFPTAAANKITHCRTAIGQPFGKNSHNGLVETHS
jgi:hypothetical protein